MVTMQVEERTSSALLYLLSYAPRGSKGWASVFSSTSRAVAYAARELHISHWVPGPDGVLRAEAELGGEAIYEISPVIVDHPTD